MINFVCRHAALNAIFPHNVVWENVASGGKVNKLIPGEGSQDFGLVPVIPLLDHNPII